MAKTETINRQQIEQSIKKKIFSPIYIFMGEESYYIDKLSNMIIDNTLSVEEKDFNLSVFYGSDCSVPDVILACRRFPVMAERQVVILKEAQILKTKNELGQFQQLFQQYAQHPVLSTIFIVCYKNGTLKAPALFKVLTEKTSNGNPIGVVFDSKKISDYGINAALAEYIRSKGCTIEDKAQSMLIEYIGNDLSKLAQEIDKLKMISPNGIRITPDMVEKHVGISKDFNVFELVKAISTKNKIKAFQIANYFREKKASPIPAASLLFSFFANLLLAHYTKSNDEKVLMDALRLKTPYALREYREGLRRYNASKCHKTIGYLREFDTKSKGVGSSQNEHDLFFELLSKIMD